MSTQAKLVQRKEFRRKVAPRARTARSPKKAFGPRRPSRTPRSTTRSTCGHTQVLGKHRLKRERPSDAKATQTPTLAKWQQWRAQNALTALPCSTWSLRPEAWVTRREPIRFLFSELLIPCRTGSADGAECHFVLVEQRTQARTASVHMRQLAGMAGRVPANAQADRTELPS
jgi:hypothetical protein